MTIRIEHAVLPEKVRGVVSEMVGGFIVVLNDALTADQADHTLRHELGHILQMIRGDADDLTKTADELDADAKRLADEWKQLDTDAIISLIQMTAKTERETG